jgi:hypothetical protein
MYITLKRYSVSLILLFIVIFSSVIIANGHGLGTDISPSITISDKQVSVEASLSPTFLDQVARSKPTFMVRALDGDPSRNSTLSGIAFRIVVELNDEVLLDQRFRSSDGIVNAHLIPDSGIQGWEVNGQANPSTQVEVSQGTPVELRSRILTAGGLYHIVAIIALDLLCNPIKNLISMSASEARIHSMYKPDRVKSKWWSSHIMTKLPTSTIPIKQ